MISTIEEISRCYITSITSKYQPLAGDIDFDSIGGYVA
jgi:hypothetical protein